ncbi:MAG: restriction endonuclease [Candidatus Bathyarchaeota archaeon]|nr:restriction endonuclease [Candidatus Bathyarchaeota archaeon]
MTTYFNGILKEIIQQYPNIDLSGYLADNLQLPLDKAEALADRIQKQYIEKIGVTEEKSPLFVRREESDLKKNKTYPIDRLSVKEFEYFTRWLLEGAKFEIEQLRGMDWGLTLVAKENGQKVAVQTVRCPRNSYVSEAILPIAEETKSRFCCEKVLVLATAYFTEQAKAEAEKRGIELWDADTLAKRISEMIAKSELEVLACFPKYQGSLLKSLLALDETKNFLVTPKTEGKYDVYLPGVKYPLLTFQAQNGRVVRCVFRIKYNEPVNENDGEVLIAFDDSLNSTGPDEAQAYEAVIQYLEQFLE